MRRVSSAPVDLKQVQIAGRALVYGFARMNIDGHFPRWGVAALEAEQTAEAILDLFIEGIASGRDALRNDIGPVFTLRGKFIARS